MYDILVVDDDPQITAILEALINRMGYAVKACTDSLEAFELVQEKPFDIVVTDLIMPVVSGLEIAQAALDAYAETMVIVITGHGSLETGISALRLGVYDYILKPFKLEEVEHAVRRAMEKKKLQHENSALRSQLAIQDGRWEMVGKSAAMEAVYSLIKRAAPIHSTVLITGESGTGKELVSRAVHRLSNRQSQPFIWVNCAAIPDNLLESQLFGHRKGAFTDAHTDRVGRFAQAHGGTLLLDEIGAMPVHLQVKLLRAIQEREILPLGAEKAVQVDVRLIASTNSDLKEMTEKGEFREDLYYRLNVISIRLPPLRERREDIPLLVNHFIQKHAKLLGVQSKPFTTDALRRLQGFHWPGNVRQLENVVEACLALSSGSDPVSVDELPAEILGLQDAAPRHAEIMHDPIALDEALASYERRLIQQAMEAAQGVKAKAAQLLKIKRTTLIEKMKRMNLNSDLPS